MGIIINFIMKLFAIAALAVAAEARHSHEYVALDARPPTIGLAHSVIPANREDYDNVKELWKNDWNSYRKSRPNDQDCSISESDNWMGAQQCSQSWECRGARLCERGGWCSGYDGCEGTP